MESRVKFITWSEAHWTYYFELLKLSSSTGFRLALWKMLFFQKKLCTKQSIFKECMLYIGFLMCLSHFSYNNYQDKATCNIIDSVVIVTTFPLESHADRWLLQESHSEQALFRQLPAIRCTKDREKHGKESTSAPTGYSLDCCKLLKLEMALENQKTVTGFLKAPTPLLPKEETRYQWMSLSSPVEIFTGLVFTCDLYWWFIEIQPHIRKSSDNQVLQ